ncbi:MAG: GIY-YIG nuclease family protein [Coriobacteriia bacterium]|nr:GIY-YIG nuclease family protein [Coriobacteriia bacterium]
MKKEAYVYFMSNSSRNVLYVGVSNNLVRRVAEHKAGMNEGFTHEYRCTRLVYYESSNSIIDAIAREKQLKNWKREWKDALVLGQNPSWKDLSAQIGVTKAAIEAIRSSSNNGN